ncbi:hypothetical protein ACFONL_01310, partial [Camelimonas fluminis]
MVIKISQVVSFAFVFCGTSSQNPRTAAFREGKQHQGYRRTVPLPTRWCFMAIVVEGLCRMDIHYLRLEVLMHQLRCNRCSQATALIGSEAYAHG